VPQLGPLHVDTPLVLAPMAGATNPPFRRLCREQGAGLVVTEMVSAKGIVTDDPKTWSLVDVQPDEHPVAVQLFGCDPGELAEAARRMEAVGADAVDVNMGCPMKKVVRTGRGAALLQEPDKIRRIMRAMSDAVTIPVTAKIRAGWESSNAVEVAHAIADGGGAGLAIHGRTRSAMYDHHVDLDVIAEVAAAVDITVIGNGDVRDRDSFDRMMATGCDAVMVARGCLGNPWLFAELRAHAAGETHHADRSASGRRAMMHRHLRLYVEQFGERRTCLEFRKHALWYVKGTAGESTLRALLRGLDTVDAVGAAVDAACDALEAG
jgi:tRNA-dihydrouridine synthase B